MFPFPLNLKVLRGEKRSHLNRQNIAKKDRYAVNRTVFFFLSNFSQKTFFPFVCKDNFHTKISLEVMRLEKNIQNEMKVLFCLNIRFGLRNFFKKKLYCLISSFFSQKKAFFFLVDDFISLLFFARQLHYHFWSLIFPWGSNLRGSIDTCDVFSSRL